MAELREIESEASFDEQLSRNPSDGVLVLNFYATWAAPCEQMRNILSTLATSYPSSSRAPAVSFLNVDAEKLVDVSERYDVSSVPYLVILKGARVVETVNGSDAAKIRDAVERHAGKAGQSAGNKDGGGGGAGGGGAATQLPPPQKVDESSSTAAAGTRSTANGTESGAKDLSAYAPKSDDPKTAPEMTSAEMPENSAGSASATEELHRRLSALVAAAPVMLFMKGTPSVPQCGFSRKLVGLLREHGVRYGFFNILADDDVRQGLKEYSDWPTFPQLYVGGELVGGLDIVSFNPPLSPIFFFLSFVTFL